MAVKWTLALGGCQDQYCEKGPREILTLAQHIGECEGNTLKISLTRICK